MTDIRSLVQAFYHEVWNANSAERAREILHEDLEFRGSLGTEATGPDGFIDYMKTIHDALAGYRCEIVSLICEDRMAAARMTFSGRHVGTFLGAAATGRKLSWSGAAFFEAHDGRIRPVWVLGDVDAIRAQL